MHLTTKTHQTTKTQNQNPKQKHRNPTKTRDMGGYRYSTSFTATTKQDQAVRHKVEREWSSGLGKHHSSIWARESMAGNRVQLTHLLVEPHPRQLLLAVGGFSRELEGIHGGGSPVPSADGLPERLRKGEGPESGAGHGEGDDGVCGEEEEDWEDVVLGHLSYGWSTGGVGGGGGGGGGAAAPCAGLCHGSLVVSLGLLALVLGVKELLSVVCPSLCFLLFCSLLPFCFYLSISLFLFFQKK